MQKNLLQDCPGYDTLSLEDMRKIYAMKEKQIALEKYTFPTEPSTDGYYHIQVADMTRKNGRRQIKAKTLGELQEKVYCFEKGLTGSAHKTFHDVFEIVQSEKIRYVKNPERLLSVQNTIGRNRSEYKRFFAGTAFERMYIDEITKKDIENIIFANLKQLTVYKKTLASMRGILNSVFSLAYCENWITDNPYSRIDFKKFKDMLAESTPIEERFHSDQDIERMLEHIHAWQKKKPYYITAYALELQILCGMRRGELPPLMWTDVTDSYLYIHQQQLTIKKQGNISEHFEIVSHTKTYKNRKYPITDEVQELLDRLKQIHDKYYRKSAFLFPAKTPNGCITNNQVYNYYRRVCKKLGIAVSRDFIKGTHAFRRTRITQVINSSNGNLILAAELFGNSPEVARQNYYTGISLSQAKQVLSR